MPYHLTSGQGTSLVLILTLSCTFWDMQTKHGASKVKWLSFTFMMIWEGTHIRSGQWPEFTLVYRGFRKNYLFCAAFFFFKILFMYSWETQRERQRNRQREKQAPHKEPDVGLDPRTPRLRPGWKAGAKSLSNPRILLCCLLKESQVKDIERHI